MKEPSVFKQQCLWDTTSSYFVGGLVYNKCKYFKLIEDNWIYLIASGADDWNFKHRTILNLENHHEINLA
jgi:hypothetical protein